MSLRERCARWISGHGLSLGRVGLLFVLVGFIGAVTLLRPLVLVALVGFVLFSLAALFRGGHDLGDGTDGFGGD